jgi:hypothetical protein
MNKRKKKMSEKGEKKRKKSFGLYLYAKIVHG